MARFIPISTSVKGFAGLLGLVGLCATLSAQAQIPTELSFQPPPVGSPGNREAGSGRSDTCADLTEQAGLTAIVPETNVGLTTQATPQLFAYVPTNNAAFAELRLLKETTGEDVYVSQVSMPAATTPGFAHQASTLSLTLPATVVLEPGENYLWALMLVCNPANRAEDIVVTAVVQRADEAYLNTLSAEVSNQLRGLNNASEVEKLTILSSAGLWQDLLTQLSTLTAADPTTYDPLWGDLLTDQGLGAIASAPVYESSLTEISSSAINP
ncbi:hypothetical protein C7293_26210 [filamentous cyanobacterium CCT1]|nr:hypothetical protein C7293_26210 [filamentous cyanobacterium CCT1]PSN77561.1 hypothetical protein C8B47_21415 [filamentous cyanobacterium CCP4]